MEDIASHPTTMSSEKKDEVRARNPVPVIGDIGPENTSSAATEIGAESL